VRDNHLSFLLENILAGGKFNMKYILVYADTVDELRENVVDDNLAYLLVSEDCLDAYLEAHGYDRDIWLNEYIAEDTVDFYNFVISNEWKYKISLYDKYPRDKEIEFMEDANTTWYNDDIKGMLEFYQIDPTEENVMKIATSEFVRGFHDRLVEYGNEMIADKVREVFDK
jgi:hypothetical protein